MIYTCKVSKIRKHFYIDTFFLKSFTILFIPLKENGCVFIIQFYYYFSSIYLEKMINPFDTNWQ